MAPTRSQSDERKYRRRGLGVMKKAYNVHDLIPNIKAAVLFLDGSNLWTYESENGWVSSIPLMENIRVEHLDHTHFRTVFERQQAMARPLPVVTEPDLEVGQSQPIPAPEPPLFVSPTLLETPRSPTPPSNEIRRQLRSGTTIGQPSTASSPTQSRKRPRVVLPSRTRNVEGKRRKHADIYGFDMDGESENET